jgi:predicted nuclease with TOPRIM domain
LNEIDKIEQELSELRQRFAQSAEILKELSLVKAQFSELDQSHQTLQANLIQAEQLFNQSPGEIQPLGARISQLEQQLEIRCEQLQAQLTSFRFDFDAINRQLHERMDRDLQGRISLGEIDEQITADLSAEDGDRLKWIESSLQHFNASIYNDRTSLQKLERRYSDLKRLVDIIAVVGGVAFFITILTIIFLPR